MAFSDEVEVSAFAPKARALAELPIPMVHGHLGGQVWEQFELPSMRGDRCLFSPCNTGPMAVRDQVVLIHDAQPWLQPEAYSPAFRAWYRFLLPQLARRARVVLTISEYSRVQLERFGVVPPGKARVVLNGADHILKISPDPDTLGRHGLIPGGYLLALGNLSPHKNLAMLMRAAAARPAGQPPLVIAGGGNSRVFADASLAPPPGVRLLGRISDGELRALYAHAAAFVFPSLTEGFGLPPLEAMLCGCPTVVSRAGAIPEVCGDASAYVDPTDEAGWIRAMVEVAALGADARQARVQDGLQHAATFTWARAARQVVDHLAYAGLNSAEA
ncbi:glycosyltransferase family 4 protein [Caulobacter henricii]|uniref:glycosyltransferase family 4 protein n=1 Tax=Caulobacter henricii TaxID=69395 RepID=UPI00141291EE|nr:glycosyltransferase family 1 protein [Caulobacter henricii]